MYGFGVWTLLGVVVIKVISSAGSMVAGQYGMSKDTYSALSEKEKEQLAQEKKLQTWASKFNFCFNVAFLGGGVMKDLLLAHLSWVVI